MWKQFEQMMDGKEICLMPSNYIVFLLGLDALENMYNISYILCFFFIWHVLEHICHVKHLFYYIMMAYALFYTITIVYSR